MHWGTVDWEAASEWCWENYILGGFRPWCRDIFYVILNQQTCPTELEQKTNRLIVSAITCFTENILNTSKYFVATGCIICGSVISFRNATPSSAPCFVIWLTRHTTTFVLSWLSLLLYCKKLSLSLLYFTYKVQHMLYFTYKVVLYI